MIEFASTFLLIPKYLQILGIMVGHSTTGCDHPVKWRVNKIKIVGNVSPTKGGYSSQQ